MTRRPFICPFCEEKNKKIKQYSNLIKNRWNWLTWLRKNTNNKPVVRCDEHMDKNNAHAQYRSSTNDEHLLKKRSLKETKSVDEIATFIGEQCNPLGKYSSANAIGKDLGFGDCQLLYHSIHSNITNNIDDKSTQTINHFDKKEESDGQINILNEAYQKQILSNDVGKMDALKTAFSRKEIAVLQSIIIYHDGEQYCLNVVEFEMLANQSMKIVDQNLFDELNKELGGICSNNINRACHLLQRLWQERSMHGNICVLQNRLFFFYQMIRCLFEKYIKFTICERHEPPCAPSVDTRLFNKIAIPIIKQFCRSINPEGKASLQLELLLSIELLIYNRPLYLTALSEVFDQLFKSSIIEAMIFKKWSAIQQPNDSDWLNGYQMTNIESHKCYLIKHLYKCGFTLLKKSNSIS